MIIPESVASVATLTNWTVFAGTVTVSVLVEVYFVSL